MRIGLYQHGSVPAPEVAEHVSARTGEKVLFRNALYFNESETEKFDRVVVDEGKNTEAIIAAYKAAGFDVSSVEEYLKQEPKEPNPAKEPKEPKPALDPDAPRGKKPVKKQGE